MATYSPESLGITAKTTGGTFQQGAWYGGRQYWNGTLGDPGQEHPESGSASAGKKVSNEVIAQTNPDNVSYINSQINAKNLQQTPQINYASMNNVSGVVSGLQSNVDTARSTLESTLGTQKTAIDEKMAALKEKEQQALDQIGTLSTPFRADLEKAQSEKLYINKNFEENQALVDELDQLLTEGNNLIKQQQEVTGLSAVRNPRIQKAMNDVAARAGVIEAVINARNGQIAQAQNTIDRSVRAIEADRADEISYYETIINLNNRDILSLDEDSKKIAQEQLDLVKGDLTRAQATQDYVKQLMLDPATAALMGEAGVSLTDSVESINAKMTNAQYAREVKDMSNEVGLEGGQAVVDPSSVPAGQLITLTDSRGVKRYYKVPVGSKLANTGSGGSKLGSVESKIDAASKQDMSFADFVVTYANTLDLADIYEAYSRSPRGVQFGPPKENSREIALLYQVATGAITPAEAEREL
jgi:hypothetical protein